MIDAVIVGASLSLYLLTVKEVCGFWRDAVQAREARDLLTRAASAQEQAVRIQEAGAQKAQEHNEYHRRLSHLQQLEHDRVVREGRPS